MAAAPAADPRGASDHAAVVRRPARRQDQRSAAPSPSSARAHAWAAAESRHVRRVRRSRPGAGFCPAGASAGSGPDADPAATAGSARRPDAGVGAAWATIDGRNGRWRGSAPVRPDSSVAIARSAAGSAVGARQAIEPRHRLAATCPLAGSAASLPSEPATAPAGTAAGRSARSMDGGAAVAVAGLEVVIDGPSRTSHRHGRDHPCRGPRHGHGQSIPDSGAGREARRSDGWARVLQPFSGRYQRAAAGVAASQL